MARNYIQLVEAKRRALAAGRTLGLRRNVRRHLYAILLTPRTKPGRPRHKRSKVVSVDRLANLSERAFVRLRLTLPQLKLLLVTVAPELAASTEPEPTDTNPGTPERVKVMEERYAQGQDLFHPRDRTEIRC